MNNRARCLFPSDIHICLLPLVLLWLLLVFLKERILDK